MNASEYTIRRFVQIVGSARAEMVEFAIRPRMGFAGLNHPMTACIVAALPGIATGNQRSNTVAE